MKNPFGHCLCIKEESSVVGDINSTKIRSKSSLTFHDWRKLKKKVHTISCSDKCQDENQNMAKVKCTEGRESEVGRKN